MVETKYALAGIMIVMCMLGVAMAINYSSNQSALTTQTQQTFNETCGTGSAITQVTFTGNANCGSFLTSQTSEFFSYGTCAGNSFVTAITTTTLNCGYAITTLTGQGCATSTYYVSTISSDMSGVGCANYGLINNVRLASSCSTSSTNYVSCSGFTFTPLASETFKAIYYVAFSQSQIVSSNFNIELYASLPAGATQILGCITAYSILVVGDGTNSCSSSLQGVGFSTGTANEIYLQAVLVVTIGATSGAIQVGIKTSNAADTAEIYAGSLIDVEYGV